MRIANFILLSFAAIEILFAVTTYMNYRQAALVQSNSERFQQSSAIVRNSNRLQRNILSIVGGLRGYLLTNELFFIQNYDSAVMENQAIIAELKGSLRSDAEQQRLLTEIESLNSNLVENVAQPLLEAKRMATLSDSSRRTFKSLQQEMIIKALNQASIDRISRRVAELVNSEYRFRETERHKLSDSVEETKRISLILIVVSIGGVAAIALLLARYISSRTRRTIKMADAVASGNYDGRIPSDAIHEFAELANALNEMSVTLSRNFSLLTRKNEELNRFAHIVSHDLKAPLRGIDNVVVWIEEDHIQELSPKVQEYLGLIKSRIRRAENLLRGILAYSRVGREKTDLSFVRVEDIINEIRAYIPSGTGIVFHVPSKLPEFRTERIVLLQVFSNLILNAFKHHNKPEGFVSVSYRERAQCYEFYVQDDGPGIDQAYHEKIFMIFETLSDKENADNTGVGLAIVKKILDDRGMKIMLTSRPGHGSIFTFEWPKNDDGKTG